jgi:hypothetical protein
MTITINGSGTITGATTMASATSFSADVTLGGSGVEILNNSGRVVVGQTGSVIQVANYQTGTLATGTGAIPFDNTIPQITEGDQYMSLAFTPTSATNKLKIDVVWMGSNPSAASFGFAVALFAVGTTNALASTFYSVMNSAISQYSFSHFMTAGTTSAITFTVRAGSANGATTSFNGQSGSQIGGGNLASSITITEIAA